LPIDPHPPETLSFIAQVEEACANLMRLADPGEKSLGGKLIYAGELDQAGCILAIAGNIGGAATLAASAQTATLRQAMHAGVFDFLVNSSTKPCAFSKRNPQTRACLRSHLPCPQAVVQQMLDRGVLPNLLPSRITSTPGDSRFDTFFTQGAQPIASASEPSALKLLIWQIPAEFARRPSEFDALLLQHLPSSDHATARWLRQSPRYLGPQFRHLRSLPATKKPPPN